MRDVRGEGRVDTTRDVWAQRGTCGHRRTCGILVWFWSCRLLINTLAVLNQLLSDMWGDKVFLECPTTVNRKSEYGVDMMLSEGGDDGWVDVWKKD